MLSPNHRRESEMDEMHRFTDGMSIEEFRAAYIAESEISAEFFDEHFVVSPCDCDFSNCHRWRVEQKLPAGE